MTLINVSSQNWLYLTVDYQEITSAKCPPAPTSPGWSLSQSRPQRLAYWAARRCSSTPPAASSTWPASLRPWSPPGQWPGTTTTPRSSLRLRQRETGDIDWCGSAGVRLPVWRQSAGGQVRGDRGLSPPPDRHHHPQWAVRVQAGQCSPGHHQAPRHQG